MKCGDGVSDPFSGIKLVNDRVIGWSLSMGFAFQAIINVRAKVYQGGTTDIKTTRTAAYADSMVYLYHALKNVP